MYTSYFNWLLIPSEKNIFLKMRKEVAHAHIHKHTPCESRSTISGVPLMSNGPVHTPSGSSCSLWERQKDVRTPAGSCDTVNPTVCSWSSPQTDAVPNVAQPGSHLNGITSFNHVLRRPVQLTGSTVRQHQVVYLSPFCSFEKLKGLSD